MDEAFKLLEATAVVPGVPGHRQRGARTGSTSRKPWTEQEVALLVEGLVSYGWGKWSRIDQDKAFTERGRNPQDLRTKAMELAKKGKLASLGIANLPV